MSDEITPEMQALLDLYTKTQKIDRDLMDIRIRAVSVIGGTVVAAPNGPDGTVRVPANWIGSKVKIVLME